MRPGRQSSIQVLSFSALPNRLETNNRQLLWVDMILTPTIFLVIQIPRTEVQGMLEPS
jgi:hypothetical protein